MALKFSTPIVVIYGEEEFFLDREIQRLREYSGRDVTLLDGVGLSDHALVSICETRSIDFEDPTNMKPRIVIVDNAQKVKAEKALKAYVEERDAKDVSTVLAMVVRDAKLSAFWGKAAKTKVFEFKKLKTYETNNEVVKWMEDEARLLGLSLDSRNATFIFQIVGDDLYRIANELRKLKLFVGTEPVTPDHLRAVLVPSATAEPYQVADAAAAKDVRKALNTLSTLYKNVADDPAVPVAYALMRQTEKLFVARSLMDNGASADDVAGRLAMHPWRCKTFFMPLVEKHTKARLLQVMQHLCRLDVEIKRTSNSKRTLVELAVLSLAS